MGKPHHYHARNSGSLKYLVKNSQNMISRQIVVLETGTQGISEKMVVCLTHSTILSKIENETINQSTLRISLRNINI